MSLITKGLGTNNLATRGLGIIEEIKQVVTGKHDIVELISRFKQVVEYKSKMREK